MNYIVLSLSNPTENIKREDHFEKMRCDVGKISLGQAAYLLTQPACTSYDLAKKKLTLHFFIDIFLLHSNRVIVKRLQFHFTRIFPTEDV